MLVLTATTLLLLAGTLAVGQWAKGVAGTASRGKAQAEAGAKSLAAQDATSAASQFGEASQAFTSVRQSMGPDWVAGVAGSIPWAGRQFTAARTLVQIGLDGSTAGAKLAGVLKKAPADSASSDPTGRFAVLLATERENIEVALNSLADASRLADGLSAEGLVPQLAKSVTSVKDVLRGAAPFLERSHALLQLESYLFSGNHRILVVSQNGAELRPTGGFAGSFGIIDVTPAGAKLEGYHDVYELPNPPGKVTPPPGAIMTDDFGFRDANWWIDFPTSAKAMLGFWSDYRQPPVDGIIAVDTVAMRDLLASTGPIRVPSYGETFSSANLLERLLYLVEVKSQATGYSARKGVLTALAAELEKRVLESSPSDLAKSALALGQAADAKHVQLYFTDPTAQAAVESLGWSGRVAPPSGTTDLVAVSDAMNVPSKVNIAMKKSVDYEVALQPDHSAETTLVLRYANSEPYPAKMPNRFGDWVRVYRMPGTIIASTTPAGAKTVTMVEFGFPAEARSFVLFRHQSRAETLIGRVPNAIRVDAAPKSESAGGGHYRLHLVRQADLVGTPTTVTVTASSGWRVTGASARLTASGASVPVTVEGDRVRMATPLSGDLDLDVEMAPS
jgi:hypothetical protein